MKKQPKMKSKMKQRSLFIEERSLFEQLCDQGNLLTGFEAVKRNGGAPGVDGVTVKEFESRIDEELTQLRMDLESWRYKPSPEQLKIYFADLVDSHSWSTVKIDRLGLQFFWKHVLKIDWKWVDIVKPPQVTTIPDILTPAEIENLIGATRKLRYRVFILTTYSMGLRLEETLSLQVGDIDASRKRVHIRRGKGHKDRLVPFNG